MPELPEVERVRRTLAERITGRTVTAVTVQRAEVVRGAASQATLLAGARVARLERRGKQLALIGRRPDGPDAGEPCLCVHLGMTGSLVWAAERGRMTEWEESGRAIKWPSGRVRQGADAPRDSATRPLDHSATLADPHTHLVWHFEGGGELRFRDVRRFGGVWPFPCPGALMAQRWNRLGDDALMIQPRRLHARLRQTRRALKTALLDQHLVAGLGNIYVDELLFIARLNPNRPAHTLTLGRVQHLVRHMRALLHRAIDAGGSTFRDYIDASGEPGGFQHRHRVYGRAHQPCRRCRMTLSNVILAGRNTVYCDRCQM